jgi:hypothetical protein
MSVMLMLRQEFHTEKLVKEGWLEVEVLLF